MDVKIIKWTYPYAGCWYDPAEESGVAEVKIMYDEEIEVKRISGKPLPACLLIPALDEAFPDWKEKAEHLYHGEKLHFNGWKWSVRSYSNRLGARDYMLQIAKKYDQRDFASLHVSMHGKLNRGINLWMGVIPPILKALSRDYPAPEIDTYSLEISEPEFEIV